MIDQSTSSDFDSVNNPGSPTNAPEGNPITARIAAVASATGIADIQQSTIDTMQARLQGGEEFNIRLQVAADRQKRQMKNLNANMDVVQQNSGGVTNDTAALGKTIYDNISSQRVEDNARASIEREAIDRIQDTLSSDPVESKLTYELMFGRGSATKVWFDEAAKNYVLAQKLKQYETESGEESWGGKVANFMTSLIPLNHTFSEAGIVSGAEGGFKNFLLGGTNLANQSETMWNKYKTPEDLASALADGGELDASLRSNATTLGGYAPSSAAELLSALDNQTESDRLVANSWSLIDTTLAPVGFGVPWGKLGSVPAMLTRTGSRSMAKSVVADAFENVIREGPEAAAKATAVKADEVIANLENSALNPRASTPNSVPLSAEVSTHLEAVAQMREQLPEIIQTTRATNPEEIAHAYEEGIKEIEKTVGRSVRDVKYLIEDVATGTKTEYKLGSPLPEQGNVVHKVEVTFGRKGGGGFATPKSAMSEAINRLGLRAEVAAEENVVERSMTNTEMGFGTKAYHGTADSFDEFDLSKAGMSTKAENTKGVIFLTNDPDVANSYARVASNNQKDNLNEVLSAKLKNGTMTDAEELQYEELLARYQDDVFGINSNANVRPVDINTTGFYEADMKGATYNGPTTQAIIDTARKQGKPGVIFRNYNDDLLNNKVSDIFAVFDTAAMRSSLAGPKIVRDVSGQYFAKAEFNISEEGFRTTKLATPDNGHFSFFRSDARRVDRSAQQKAVAGGANADKLKDAITKRLKESVKGISKADRDNLDQILRKGSNEAVWLNDSQFNQLYERLTGNLPNERLLGAYKEFRLANDFEYTLRNDEIYKGLATRGYENVEFDLGQTGIKVNGNARVRVGGTRPTERVFNATDNVHYNSRNPLTADEFDRLSGEGYLLIDVEKGVSFPDGTQARKVLIHRSQATRSALRREQLAYSAGGHRAYTGKYFIKQTVRGTQPDTGGEYLKNPNVFRTGDNPNRLHDWAAIFNRAIDDAKKGILDPQHFDDNVFANTRGLKFPTGKEFVEAVEAKTIRLDDHVEVMGDRELPKAYNNGRDDIDRFVDEDESSSGGYYRSTGRLYTSSKGDHLLDETGEFAETVDPWETTNVALSNISRMSSLAGYKANVLERFAKTYGEHLKLRQLENATPSEMIRADVADNVAPRLARQIRAEQAAVSRILNFETDFEKRTKHATRELAEWVLGDARGGAREMGHDFVYWLSKNNPVNFLRGLAFDAKLGLFNAGQFVLQSSTMAASIALSPVHGFKGFAGALPMYSYMLSKGSESVLDKLAKNGAWKVAAFESEQEFKDFARFMNRSGFMDVSSTHLSVNDFRPNRVFGATSKIDGVRQMGRAFFYGAEQFNRATAGRIAWEELKEAGVQAGSAEFRERFIGLADDYSFNMTHESSAAFQKGLWSVPTQFWAYNIRMMDTMFGNRFTHQQKARLIFSQLAMFGAGGVPVVDAVVDYAKKQSGTPIETGSIASVFDRGLLDNGIAAITGADVRVGERLGTGPFLTNLAKDIFGMGEYGEKSPIEALGGATFSISMAGGKTIADAVKYSMAETGADQGYAITKDNLLKMASNISTVSNLTKAMALYNYGIFKSNKGAVQVTDLPSADAFAVAMGMRPQEVDNAALMLDFTKNRDEVIKDASTQVRNWRIEAFNVPDKYEENMKKVNFFQSLLPSSIRTEVIKRTNKTTGDSFYEHVEQKYQTEKLKADIDE